MLAGCGRIAFEPLSDARGGDGGGSGGGDATDSAGATTRLYYVVGDGTSRPTELFDLEPSSGQLTLLGTIPMTFGEADGLAAWDENTLYMTTFSGNLVEITLNPFGSQLVMGGLSQLTSLDRLGTQLVAIDDTLDDLVFLTPSPTAIDNSFPLFEGASPVTVDGGDLVVLSSTVYKWWTNVGLYYEVNQTGDVLTLGAQGAGAPYITGLAQFRNIMYAVTRDNAQLFEVGPTGNLVNPITMCVTCPSPPYVSTFGDLAVGPAP